MLVEWHCVETCSFISSAKDNTVHQPQKIQLLLLFFFFCITGFIRIVCTHLILQHCTTAVAATVKLFSSSREWGGGGRESGGGAFYHMSVQLCLTLEWGDEEIYGGPGTQREETADSSLPWFLTVLYSLSAFVVSTLTHTHSLTPTHTQLNGLLFIWTVDAAPRP